MSKKIRIGDDDGDEFCVKVGIAFVVVAFVVAGLLVAKLAGFCNPSIDNQSLAWTMIGSLVVGGIFISKP